MMDMLPVDKDEAQIEYELKYTTDKKNRGGKEKEEKTGTLEVYIKRLQNLPIMNKHDMSTDPFVKVSVENNLRSAFITITLMA